MRARWGGWPGRGAVSTTTVMEGTPAQGMSQCGRDIWEVWGGGAELFLNTEGGGVDVSYHKTVRGLDKYRSFGWSNGCIPGQSCQKIPQFFFEI